MAGGLAIYQLGAGSLPLPLNYLFPVAGPSTPGTAVKVPLVDFFGNGVSYDGLAGFGQAVGTAGDPAQLLESREVPLAGFNLVFRGGGTVSVGTLPSLPEAPTAFNVTGGSELDWIYLSGDVATGWSNHAGINTFFRRVNLGNGEFGDMIEDLTSVYVTAGFRGYAGAYFTPYMYGNLLSPAPGVGAYCVGVSGLPVYDNAGATALAVMAGFDSGISSTNGSLVTDAYDFWARELNSVNRVSGTGDVQTHINFYAEQCTRAVAQNWGLYINGPQVNWLGGGLSINATNSVPSALALLDVVSTTKGVMLPRMTTTQKNAIVSPPESLIVYDLTLHLYQFWNGTIWTNL